jgi:hypothetical protein
MGRPTTGRDNSIMKKMSNHVKDITGQRFSRLTVIEFVEIRDGVAMWSCLCSCGNKLVCRGVNLKKNNTKSCGCLKRDVTIARNISLKTTHGMYSTPIYKVWASMKRRCCCPSSHNYKNYGGRGITICKRWMSFENFYEDMGDRPSDQHSIERLDNDKGYNRENCCWVLPEQQTRNKRSNRNITYKGETKILADWAKQFNISRVTISSRIKRGWSVEDALTRKTRRRQ